MSVTNVEKDFENLAMTLTADFRSSADQVWELWSDPRKLERWWGPPTHPATVEEHDLAPGEKVTYFMTAPDGQKFRGYWLIESVEPARALAFTDGFADDNGTPNDQMPLSSVAVSFGEHEGGTRMEIRSTFGSREQMDSLIEMGMEEGIKQAVSQMDALLDA